MLPWKCHSGHIMEPCDVSVTTVQSFSSTEKKGMRDIFFL